ncbi:MAG: hypothetical protein ACP5DZ_05805, partial [Bacteroidales bacterium]
MRLYQYLTVACIVILFSSCGNKNKEVTITYPNGQPQKLEYFHYEGNNRKVDRVVYYYKEGNIESEIEMTDGKKDGKVIYYYENGQEHLVEH